MVLPSERRRSARFVRRGGRFHLSLFRFVADERMKSERVWKSNLGDFESNVSSALYRVCMSLSLVSFITRFTMMMMMMTTFRVVLHARIANRVVEGSCCRGGIVNTRGVCSRERLVRRDSPKALWRFRVSTSNSPSGLSRPPTDTPVRYIYHTYAQQDIRVCGDDHFQQPKLQYSNPKALSLLRVSI